MTTSDRLAAGTRLISRRVFSGETVQMLLSDARKRRSDAELGVSPTRASNGVKKKLPVEK